MIGRQSRHIGAQARMSMTCGRPATEWSFAGRVQDVDGRPNARLGLPLIDWSVRRKISFPPVPGRLRRGTFRMKGAKRQIFKYQDMEYVWRSGRGLMICLHSILAETRDNSPS